MTKNAPRLDVIGLVVSDLDASLTFYRRLGLEFGPVLGEGHVEAELPGGFRLALDTEAVIASFHPNWRPPQGDGRIGLAFHCDSPADVDRLFEELVAAGHHAEMKPFDAPWGQRYAVVHDPDGNGVDLYAALDA
ncbi:glyoxalase [Nocardia otitidiscaviarum]|uniref:Glyoxalase n=1 Tax=Nocardia otitidiscaviarum TaxID=1823 RepID=A0A516NTU0_9NOCA|nr:VOC family protein [Nocardia otitidiscaviarum]MCP9621662.1 VOC family protein [Nocardia otitidiscaviarum]QDP82318.1 glyoxalase [Nocardia otitidiscaviarum]